MNETVLVAQGAPGTRQVQFPLRSGGAHYWVEYATLAYDGTPATARHPRPFRVSRNRWEEVSEQEAFGRAKALAEQLRSCHRDVVVVRVGPRGGRRTMAC